MKISHTADIHIRSLTRHDEHEHAFKNLLETSVKNGSDYLLIAGDTFHTKTSGISPEYIDLLSRWIDKFSKAFKKVIITLGNHDLNLKNLERGDAVSPIVTAMNLQNVFILKNTTQFEIDKDTVLSVFSIVDPEKWEMLKPIAGKINIATFHGPVSGCRLDSGIEYESGVSISLFDGFDFGMLGDIHKTQFLNAKKTIGYPGSIIQNTFDEEIDKGYFLWDITSPTEFTCKFVSVGNLSPSITCKSADDYRSIGISGQHRVRWILDEKSVSQDIKELTEIAKSAGASSVSFKKEKAQDNTGTQRISAENREYRNFENVYSLIKETHQLQKEEESYLYDYLKSAFASLPDESELKNCIWDLESLAFSNIHGSGEQNIINFSKLNGVVGLFGKNAAGKSSTISALTYCIFNSSDRGAIKNKDIINEKAMECSSEVKIKHSSKLVNISRSSKRTKTSASTTSQFFVEGSSKAGEQRSETDKEIREWFGNQNDFFMTAVSTQDDLQKFIKEGSTSRKSLLTRYIDIDFFETILEKIKSDIKTYEMSLKGMSISSEESIQNEIDETKKKKIELELLVEMLDQKRKDLSISSKKPVDIHVAKRKLEEVSAKIAMTTSKISALESRLREQSLLFDSIKDVQDMSAALSGLKARFAQIDKEIAVKKNETEQTKKKLLVLNEVPCGTTFPDCKFISDAWATKDRMSEIKEEIAKISADYTKTKSSLKTAEENQVHFSAKKTAQFEIKKCIDEIEMLKNNLEILTPNLKAAQEEYDQSASYDWGSYEKYIDAENRWKSAFIEVERCAYKIANLEKILKAASSLILKKSTLEKIQKSFSKKGLPAQILKSKIPEINLEIEQIMSPVGFTAEFEITESGDLDIYILKDGKRRLVELGSGMEKTLTALSIRVALRNISTMPKPNFFIIDEGISTLDSDKLNECAALIQSIKKNFSFVLLITHNDALKDCVDFELEIKKTESGSVVRYE